MEEFRRIKRELVAKGAIIDYYQDTMQIPNGNIAKWDLIDHKGAAAVVAVREDGKLLMVRQYRNALERETLEIPAGGLNGREEPTDQAAMRELQEETGYHTDHVELLTSIYTTVAFCNEKIDIYLALDLKERGSQHLDEDEVIEVEAWELKDLEEMIYTGKITDGKTIAALMAYGRKYRSVDKKDELA
mgnify:CR=1 FL=1